MVYPHYCKVRSIGRDSVPWKSSGFNPDAVKSVHAIQGLKCCNLSIFLRNMWRLWLMLCAAVASSISLKLHPHIVSSFRSYHSNLSLHFCLVPVSRSSTYIHIIWVSLSHMLHYVLCLSPFPITSSMSIESLRSNGFLLGAQRSSCS